MRTDIRVLGPVELRRGDRRVDLGSPKQSGVFAILAAEVGRLLSADRLEYRLWADHPPRHARRTLHSYLTRLRGVLADVDGPALQRRSGGYLLDVDAECVDLYRFRRLCAEARSATTVSQAAKLWHEALAVWNGDAFADLDIPGLNKLRSELHGARDIAELERNDTFIHTGRSAELLPHIRSRVARRPLDERLSGQLMEVLYRLGRASEALEHYRTLHDRMTGELGHEPGADLRKLHRRILTGAGDAADPPATAAPVVVPRQLPTAPSGFVGRTAEFGRLSGATGDAAIWVISGPGGTGKTWLAAHWAHRNAEAFPDGQLYADLRGFDPVAEPIPPEAVLAEFLEALGVPASTIPRSLQARAGLFRTVTAGRRLLVVLDNARDAEQVVPLLAGHRGCTTLITSRRDATALTVSYGARQLALGRLPDEDAHRALNTQVPIARLDAEPEAVAELIGHCAGLPLALGIIAAQAAMRPRFPLAALASELRDETARLDLLDTGELATGVRAVLKGSYRALSKPAAQVFDLCGLVTGTGWDRYALASLTGIGLRELRPILSELEQSHLLEQFEPGRYRMHDLTALYATEHARGEIAEPQRGRALRRWVDHYLHTAQANCLMAEPQRRTFDLAEPAEGCVHPAAPDEPSAHRWLAVETANLLAAQQIAERYGWDSTRHFGAVLSGYWQMRGMYEPAAAVAEVAIGVEASADRAERAHILAVTAYTYGFLGRLDEASAVAAESRVLADGTDDLRLRSYVYCASGFVSGCQDDHRQAVQFDLRALECDRAAGWVRDEGVLLNGLAWNHANLGDYDKAVRYCRESLDHYRRHPNPESEAAVLDTMGFIAQRRGDPGEALDLYQRALERLVTGRRSPARPLARESDALEHIGDAYRELGDVGRAVEFWRRGAAGYRSHHQYGDADRLGDKVSQHLEAADEAANGGA